jgi:hypothetical protein
MAMAGCLQAQSHLEAIIYVPDCYSCHAFLHSMADQRAVFQITIIRWTVLLPVFHEAQARNDS